MPATSHDPTRHKLMRRRAPMRVLAVPLAALGLLISLVVGLVVGTAAPAQADSYRYWSYYVGQDGTWGFAQTGPADRALADRDVDGWQFGIFGAEGGATPEQPPVFAQLCPELEAAGVGAGQVRVAVVIDAGGPDEAPQGETPIADRVECLLLPDGSNGYQALAKAADLRTKDGLVCGIDGYPAQECAAIVESPTAPATSSAQAGDDIAETPQGADDRRWLWAAAALLLAGGVVLALSRRRRA